MKANAACLMGDRRHFTYLEEERRMSTFPVIDMAATGRNIIRLREQAGLTVKELQDLFGFATPQAIYKWQHGTAMPTVDNLLILSQVFSVTIDDIIVCTTK